ncbi:hypothetical protein [Nitrososphaera sp.]|uniref:hypothetical protein n=1 Tax=Nitrososphaera sp. TaxID=1971748 RepID=UPI00307F75EF
MDEATKKFMMNQLMWIGIYFAISIAISLILPFPISLVVLIGVIIGIAYWRRRAMMRRMGQAGPSFFGGGNPFASKGIDYYCMNCGTKHNKASCPNCGSKLKKAGF